jgi:uncharacterized protein with von Willebrand factor type A (vWA) domain
MRARLERLVSVLRARGLGVSVAEAVDAARAATVVGVERARLRDALAAVLVKDERDRALFEEAFASVLPARVDERGVGGRRKTRRQQGEPGGEGGQGSAGGSGGGPPRGTRARASRAEEHHDRPRVRPGDDADRHSDAAARQQERRGAERAASREEDATGAGETLRARRAREHALLQTPARLMSPRDVEEAAALVAALARRLERRVRRRLRPRTRGRLDVRRTLRAAVARGGVPLERRYRGRRPVRVSLVALCDLSASTATATAFFLAVLAPASRHFARVRLYGFVDRLVEIEFIDGQVRPAGPIDLMARSDFGSVLKDLVADDGPALTADTVLLILGDARNNRRPPRADLLRRARARVRRVLWLNPESEERWNTGDSVIASYAPHADAVVACGSLAELDRALAEVARL